MARVHLVGVSGTGMGALAILFRERGFDVTGSDVSFDPPIGPALEKAGVVCLSGYSAEHITDHASGKPDFVVVGNAIRKDNPEAVAVNASGIPALSMSGALREHFLKGRKPLVVCGTHGKTTTSAMCAWLLTKTEMDPGYFIGGIPKNFASGASAGSSKRKLNAPQAGARSPFVVEGDEYDAVYWHKKPKFFDYIGIGNDDVAIVTSVEHDHIDIYPDAAVYDAQFAELAERMPPDGLIVCDAHDKRAREIISKHAKCRTAFYALEGDDTGDVTPTWLGAPVTIDEAGLQPFDLYAGGVYVGRLTMQVPGSHNIRNAIAAIAACAEGFGAPISSLKTALATFTGVKRRQDLLGTPNGVRVYDDFAHHPTAVDETLRALRSKHPGGKLWAVFEPRSATACRALHQNDYVGAFGSADRVLFAPLGRTNVPAEERLDTDRLAKELGEKAVASPSIDAILDTVARDAKPGDTVALLSNGAFGGLHAKLLAALGDRS